MHSKKLRGQLLGTDTSKDDKKCNIWAEHMQCLDKRSIMMLESECKGKWGRSMEAVDGTLLQFRDAACDELAGPTNVSVVETG